MCNSRSPKTTIKWDFYILRVCDITVPSGAEIVPSNINGIFFTEPGNLYTIRVQKCKLVDLIIINSF